MKRSKKVQYIYDKLGDKSFTFGCLIEGKSDFGGFQRGRIYMDNGGTVMNNPSNSDSYNISVWCDEIKGFSGYGHITEITKIIGHPLTIDKILDGIIKRLGMSRGGRWSHLGVICKERTDFSLPIEFQNQNCINYIYEKIQDDSPWLAKRN